MWRVFASRSETTYDLTFTKTQEDLTIKQTHYEN